MTQSTPKPNRLPLYITGALIVVILVAFGIVFTVNLNTADNMSNETASPGDYRERVDALLAIGQPENAEAALIKYTCTACHRGENSIGPLFEGIAERAATRRPPMPADEYIYESIIHPGAFIVEGYQNVMLPDIGSRISDQELADVLTYLLTPDAH